MLGAVKNVTVEDIENLKKTADMYHRTKHELDKTLENYERIKKHAPNLGDKLSHSMEKKRLGQLEKAFAQLPADIKDRIMPDNIQDRGFDRNR